MSSRCAYLLCQCGWWRNTRRPGWCPTAWPSPWTLARRCKHFLLASVSSQHPACVSDRLPVCLSAVRLCVAAVQRKRLRRPAEDLHSPAGWQLSRMPQTGSGGLSTSCSWRRPLSDCLQVNGKSLSVKQYLDEPGSSLSMVTHVCQPAKVRCLLVANWGILTQSNGCFLWLQFWSSFNHTDRNSEIGPSVPMALRRCLLFPQDEFPEVLKWRRKPSLPAVSSSLPDLLGDSTPVLAADTPFSSHTLTGECTSLFTAHKV